MLFNIRSRFIQKQKNWIYLLNNSNTASYSIAQNIRRVLHKWINVCWSIDGEYESTEYLLEITNHQQHSPPYAYRSRYNETK